MPEFALAIQPFFDFRAPAQSGKPLNGRKGKPDAVPLRTGFHEGKTELAERTGLEPATPGVTGRYSNRLNYRSFFAATDLVGADGIEPPTFAV